MTMYVLNVCNSCSLNNSAQKGSKGKKTVERVREGQRRSKKVKEGQKSERGPEKVKECERW